MFFVTWAVFRFQLKMIKGCLLVILFAGVAAAERSGEIKLSGANGPLFVGEASTKGTEKTVFLKGNQKSYAYFFGRTPCQCGQYLPHCEKIMIKTQDYVITGY